MKKEDFNYTLPEELIAHKPLVSRDSSRLLCMSRLPGNPDKLQHKHFHELPELLRTGDTLILNNSRVLPARLTGTRTSGGGTVEVLLIREIEKGDGSSFSSFDENEEPSPFSILPPRQPPPQLSIITWECLVRPGKKLKPGTNLTFGQGELTATVKGVLPDGNRIIEFQSKEPFGKVLENLGKMPLPPYIKEELQDPERYQTVYATEPGSCAAPTAGLHFTRTLLESLNANGIETSYITLHVGPGTFKPVKSENIEDHTMHSEAYTLSRQTSDLINKTKESGGRVIAVGTTTCRVLESVSDESGKVSPAQGETDIFICPGYKFKCIDGLITNFHLPESTLIMLVSALAGRERILDAYKTAIAERYRFYSFGDAMLII